MESSKFFSWWSRVNRKFYEFLTATMYCICCDIVFVLISAVNAYKLQLLFYIDIP
jgi:hypothetical protein